MKKERGTRKKKNTLWFLNMPSPISLTTASTSIFHFPSLISPNQDIICVETVLETSWLSASAVERASTEANVCCIERDTRRLRTSSRSVPRYDGAIGRSSSVILWSSLRFETARHIYNYLLLTMRILLSFKAFLSSASLACTSLIASW